MIHTKTFKLVFLQILIIISTKSFSQDIDKHYNHETATIELENVAKKISTGLPYNISPNLVQYMYENHEDFPKIPENSSSRNKMETLAPTFTQINIILKSQSIAPQDSISKKQAMLAATLGYQSIKIISLSNEFINSLDKDAYNYKTRVRGFNQGIKGLQQYLLGYTTMTFLENQNQNVDYILISNLKIFAPKILNEFPKDEKELTIQLLKSSIEGKNDIRLINEFNSFIESL